MIHLGSKGSPSRHNLYSSSAEESGGIGRQTKKVASVIHGTCGGQGLLFIEGTYSSTVCRLS